MSRKKAGFAKSGYTFSTEKRIIEPLTISSEEVGDDILLNIFFGYDTEAILSIDKYFNNIYDEEWFDDPYVKEMVLDIDCSEVLDRYCIQSPVLGQIPPEKLSGGVKALICMYKLDDFYVDLIVCGKNCEKWIAEIANKKEIKASLSGYDLDFEATDIHAKCLNDNMEIHGYKEWILKMCSYVGGSYER